jgi:hypothetical protein
MPLKRMPTELMLTTRMPPVRQTGKPASGVRPLSDPSNPAEPAFDRRPTAPMRRDPDAYAVDSDNRLQATAVADYAVHEYYDYDAPPQEATTHGGYAPAPLHNAPVRESYPPPPPPPRRPAAERKRIHTPARPQHAAVSGGYAPADRTGQHAAVSGGYAPGPRFDRETATDARHGAAGHAPASDALTQLRRQLATAMDNARKHEQRAMEAELRASWAERFVPQQQDPELEQRALRRHNRMRWLKRVLEISCVGLALGGYISLLIPVRERVIAQDAMIHELTALQQQLRDEKHVLLERIQTMQAPSGSR